MSVSGRLAIIAETETHETLSDLGFVQPVRIKRTPMPLGQLSVAAMFGVGHGFEEIAKARRTTNVFRWASTGTCYGPSRSFMHAFSVGLRGLIRATLRQVELFAPLAGQAFGVVVADERDKLFANLATQVPGAAGIAC